MNMVAEMVGVSESVMVDSPGKMIAAARKAQGMSLDTIHERTLIPVWKLKALENEQYKQLGSRPFAVGYIRQVAKLLGLDTDAVVQNFNQITNAEDVQRGAVHSAPVMGAPPPINEGAKRHFRSLWSPWTLLILVAIWSVSVWIFQGDNGAEGEVRLLEEPQDEELLPEGLNDKAEVSPPQIAPEEAPAEQNSEQAEIESKAPEATAADDDSSKIDAAEVREEGSVVTPAASTPTANTTSADIEEGQDTIAMVFSSECWVEIRDAKGTRIVAQLYNKGDNLQRSGEGPFSVLLGDVRAAEVTMNGEPVSVKPRGTQKTLRFLVSSSSD